MPHGETENIFFDNFGGWNVYLDHLVISEHGSFCMPDLHLGPGFLNWFLQQATEILINTPGIYSSKYNMAN